MLDEYLARLALSENDRLQSDQDKPTTNKDSAGSDPPFAAAAAVFEQQQLPSQPDQQSGDQEKLLLYGSQMGKFNRSGDEYNLAGFDEDEPMLDDINNCDRRRHQHMQESADRERRKPSQHAEEGGYLTEGSRESFEVTTPPTPRSTDSEEAHYQFLSGRGRDRRLATQPVMLVAPQPTVPPLDKSSSAT